MPRMCPTSLEDAGLELKSKMINLSLPIMVILLEFQISKVW